MPNRLFRVFCLLLLSPLIAEYLLGSLPVSMAVALPVLILMYGGGAVLIRELVRKTGRGWPSIILLSLAYGLIEEGLVTQSLFNPNYLLLRLLDYGFVSWLGTSPVWAVFVLGLHMFWSIAAPIGLAESLFPAHRRAPWLGWVGIGVMVALFAAGSGLIARFTYSQLPFMATPVQLGGIAALAVLLIVAALFWPIAKTSRPESQPLPPAVMFLIAFVPGSLFMLVKQFAPHFPFVAPSVTLAILIGCQIVVLIALVVCTRDRVWTDGQRFGLVAGALGVYLWVGFLTDIDLHGLADLPAHSVLAIAVLIVIVFAGWRNRTAKSS